MEKGMEKAKEKRRRSDGDEEKRKRVAGAAEEEEEEEVEEFFAILRRMQVAVKYFEKGNGEGWRAAVEADVAAVVGGDDQGKEMMMRNNENQEEEKAVVEEENTMVNLDLNVTPEVDVNGITNLANNTKASPNPIPNLIIPKSGHRKWRSS